MLNSVCKTKRLFVLNRVRSGYCKSNYQESKQTNFRLFLGWSLLVVAIGHAALTPVLKQCIAKQCSELREPIKTCENR